MKVDVNNKLSLDELIDNIEPKKSVVCRRVLGDYKDDFEKLPGSRTKHQDWEGGLCDHIEETMNIACVLFDSLNDRRKLPFTLSEALFMLFFHDFDKVIRYGHRDEFDLIGIDHHGLGNIVVKLIRDKYNYQFSDIEINTLRYVHGENEDYHSTNRVMLPLTAFVHCCDIVSARIWYDQGKDSARW